VDGQPALESWDHISFVSKISHLGCSPGEFQPQKRPSKLWGEPWGHPCFSLNSQLHLFVKSSSKRPWLGRPGREWSYSSGRPILTPKSDRRRRDFPRESAAARKLLVVDSQTCCSRQERLDLGISVARSGPFPFRS
jgi:hypothetical protein